MARIRSLKPEFWDDRKLARSTTRDTRMLYMGLWNQSDEHCRLNGDALWLKGRIFPYDDDVTVDDVASMLNELEQGGWVNQYMVDGDPFLFLPKLGKHQRLEPSKATSRHPAPPAQIDSDPGAEQSAPRADNPAPDAEQSAPLYVAGSMDQGTGSMGHGSGARGARIPDDWTPSLEVIDAMRSEGIPDELARRELPKFRDHWIAKTGRDATKRDWDATWRNWLRRAVELSPSGRASPTGSTADQRVNDGLHLAASLRAEQNRRELPA